MVEEVYYIIKFYMVKNDYIRLWLCLGGFFIQQELYIISNNGKFKCAVVYENVPNNFILIRKWWGVEND